MKKILIVGLSLLFVLSGSLWAVDQWQEINPTLKPAPRSGHSLVTINGMGYLFGGKGPEGRPEIYNDLWKYDPTNKDWTRLNPPSSPVARHSHSAAVSNGKMYVFFGVDSEVNVLRDIWSYDPVGNNWQQEPSSGSTPSARFLHSSIAIPDGRILTFGGLGGDGNPTDPCVWSYTPGVGSWEQRYYSPAGSVYGQSASIFSGKMYIFGGYGCEGHTNNMMVYDPGLDSWEKVTIQGSIPMARTLCASAYSGDLLWIFGGERASRGGDLKDTWEFSAANNTWTQRTDMPIALSGAQSIALQSQDRAITTLMFGGTSGGVPVDKTYGYFPDSNPPPVEKMVLNQIGALGKGHFSLFFLRFTNVQEKVKVELEWTQANAKLKLCVIRIPHFWAHEYFWDFLGGMEPNQLEGVLQGVGNVEPGEEKVLQVSDRNKIEKTVEKVRGLLLWVRHSCHSETAKDIQLSVKEMKDDPKQAFYLFPIAPFDKGNTPRLHFIHLPVAPVRWHSHFPHGTQGDESTQAGSNFWEWRFLDRTPRPRCFAFVKFDLP